MTSPPLRQLLTRTFRPVERIRTTVSIAKRSRRLPHERARFVRPLALAEGFDAIDAYLASTGRSPAAFCSCELRSPAAGLVAFNRRYVAS